MGDIADMSKDKIMRKITFQLYKDKKHEATHQSSLYKFNKLTGEEAIDPFKSCKTLDDVRQVLLTGKKKYLQQIFNEKEKYDFVLVKINKRGLGIFQQIFPQELINSVRFIKEE